MDIYLRTFYVFHNKCLCIAGGLQTVQRRDRLHFARRGGRMKVPGDGGELAIQQFSEFKFGTLSKTFGLLFIKKWAIDSRFKKITRNTDKPLALSFEPTFLEDGVLVFNGDLTGHNTPPFAWIERRSPVS